MAHIPHTSIGYCIHRLRSVPRPQHTYTRRYPQSPTAIHNSYSASIGIYLTSCIIRLRPSPFLLSRPQQNKTLLRHLLRHLIRPQAKPACSYGITEPLPRRSEGKEDGKVGTALTNTLSPFLCVSRSCLGLRVCWVLLGCGWVVVCTVGPKITVYEYLASMRLRRVVCGVVFCRLALFRVPWLR